MRRGSFASAGGRFCAAARYGSEESSFISQIQPVLRPRSSATWARVNSSASPRFTERLSSLAIAFSTESSWLRRRRSFLLSDDSGIAPPAEKVYQRRRGRSVLRTLRAVTHSGAQGTVEDDMAEKDLT